jgi:hypothetical protein
MRVVAATRAGIAFALASKSSNRLHGAASTSCAQYVPRQAVGEVQIVGLCVVERKRLLVGEQPRGKRIKTTSLVISHMGAIK